MISIKDSDINNRRYGMPIIEIDVCESSEMVEKTAPTSIAWTNLGILTLLVLGILAFILDVFY